MCGQMAAADDMVVHDPAEPLRRALAVNTVLKVQDVYKRQSTGRAADSGTAAARSTPKTNAHGCAFTANSRNWTLDLLEADRADKDYRSTAYPQAHSLREIRKKGGTP